MDKLELKHLAGYLPYGLRVNGATYNNEEFISELVVGITNSEIIIDLDLGIVAEQGFPLEHCKPILRPLSDFKKTIEINGKIVIPSKVIPFIIDEDGFCFDANDEFGIYYLPAIWHNMLLEWHFDIYGLIEKGLAIDKNTI